MPNPLLEMNGLPPLHAIRPEDVEPAIDAALTENRGAFVVAAISGMAGFGGA